MEELLKLGNRARRKVNPKPITERDVLKSKWEHTMSLPNYNVMNGNPADQAQHIPDAERTDFPPGRLRQPIYPLEPDYDPDHTVPKDLAANRNKFNAKRRRAGGSKKLRKKPGMTGPVTYGHPVLGAMHIRYFL